MSVTALIASFSTTASWKEYPQPQLGFVVEFPADPASSTGNYKTDLVPSTVAHTISVTQEHAVYVASVIDLTAREKEGATLLGEAESWFRQLGEVTSVSVSRVEPGRDGVFGRFMTIQCQTGRPSLAEIGQVQAIVSHWFKSITGVDCPNGSLLVVNLFFHRGRLYLIQGLNLPSSEDV